MRYKGFKNSNRNENNDENISNNNFSSIYNVTSNNKSRIKNNINNLIENKSTKVKTNNDIALDEEKSSNISEDLSNDSFTLSDDSTSMKMEKNYFLESNNNPKFKFEINEKINYSFIEYENDDNKDVIYNIDDLAERNNRIVKSDFCLNNSGDCLNISNCSLIKGEKENSEIDFSKNNILNSPIPLFIQNHSTVSSPVKDEKENAFNIKSKDKGIKKCDNINNYNKKNNNLFDSIPKIENEKNNINNILGMNNDFSQGENKEIYTNIFGKIISLNNGCGNFSFISNNNKNINNISSPYDSPILNSMNGKKDLIHLNNNKNYKDEEKDNYIFGNIFKGLNSSPIMRKKENPDLTENFNSMSLQRIEDFPPFSSPNNSLIYSPVKTDKGSLFNFKFEDKGIKKCDNINLSNYNENNDNKNLLDLIPKIENEKNNNNNLLGTNNNFSQGENKEIYTNIFGNIISLKNDHIKHTIDNLDCRDLNFDSKDSNNISDTFRSFDSPILNSMNGKKDLIHLNTSPNLKDKNEINDNKILLNLNNPSIPKVNKEENKIKNNLSIDNKPHISRKNKRIISEIKKAPKFVIMLTKKRGRYSLEKLAIIDKKRKRHSKYELCNTRRKIIRACKKSINKFLNSLIHLKGFKFFEPTITEQIKGKCDEIVEFLKNTLYTIYTKYTKPKRVKNDKVLKNIKTIEDKNKKKMELLAEFHKKIDELMKKEENKKEKPITALLNLTFLDYLKIFLDYGYKNKYGIKRTKKEIKICENKYGIKTIKLKNFDTYIKIKEKFSLDKEEQKYYRACLRNLIKGK